MKKNKGYAYRVCVIFKEYADNRPWDDSFDFDTYEEAAEERDYWLMSEECESVGIEELGA